MPLFMCIMPDQLGAIDRRKAVRNDHLKLGAELKAKGVSIFGRPWISTETGEMAGSTRLVRCPSVEAVWAQLRSDPYWTGNVWDVDKIQVLEMKEEATDATLRMETSG